MKLLILFGFPLVVVLIVLLFGIRMVRAEPACPPTPQETEPQPPVETDEPPVITEPPIVETEVPPPVVTDGNQPVPDPSAPPTLVGTKPPKKKERTPVPTLPVTGVAEDFGNLLVWGICFAAIFIAVGMFRWWLKGRL